MWYGDLKEEEHVGMGWVALGRVIGHSVAVEEG